MLLSFGIGVCGKNNTFYFSKKRTGGDANFNTYREEKSKEKSLLKWLCYNVLRLGEGGDFTTNVHTKRTLQI